MSSLSLDDLLVYYIEAPNSEIELEPHLRQAYRLLGIYEVYKTAKKLPQEAAKLRIFIDFFDGSGLSVANFFTHTGKQAFNANDSCIEPETFTKILNAFLNNAYFEPFWGQPDIKTRMQAHVQQEQYFHGLRSKYLAQPVCTPSSSGEAKKADDGRGVASKHDNHAAVIAQNLSNKTGEKEGGVTQGQIKRKRQS